jgi:signal transduction histidine kinase
VASIKAGFLAADDRAADEKGPVEEKRDDSPRFRAPTSSWWAMAAGFLALSLAAAFFVNRAYSQVERERIGAVASAVESDIEEQAGRLALDLVGVGALFDSADHIGFLELVRYIASVTVRIPDDAEGMSANEGLKIIGVAGLAFFTSASDPATAIVVSSNDGVSAGDLAHPEAVATASAASATLKPTLGRPFRIESVGTPVVPLYLTLGDGTSQEDAAVAFLLVPEEMAQSALIKVASDVVVSLVDTGSGLAMAGTQGSRGDPDITLDVGVLGRTWQLQVWEGSGFSSPSGVLASGLVAAMGVLLAAMTFALGVAQRNRQAHQAEKLRLAQLHSADKDRFIAAVSHELRTPLTVIVGLADELSSRPAVFRPGEYAELTNIIAGQAYEMRYLIDDLLVAARADTDALSMLPAVVDIGDQWQELRRTLPEEQRGRVDTRIEPSVQAVADPVRLRQILRNLVSNAMRYGGPSVSVTAAAGESTVSILVADDGEPIPASESERIFAPYYQSAAQAVHQPASVGLGLTVARSLARLQGGELTYRYQEGRNVFELELPRAVADGAADGRVAGDRGAAPGAEREVAAAP